MDHETESKIKAYLSDEDKLYQDWYRGINPVDEEYASPVSVDQEDLNKFKKWFEKWFRQQRNQLQQLCEGYCQKRQELQNQEPLLIAFVADNLATVFMGIPINLLATATILSSERILDNLCGYSN